MKVMSSAINYTSEKTTI